MIVLGYLKTQAFHSGEFWREIFFQNYVTNPGSKAWVWCLLCGPLESQWWLHPLLCLATGHSLLGPLLSTSALLSIIPSLLLLPTPPLWRAFYCTTVRCTVLRGKSLSPYMAQYSPIAEHQGGCLQYTQSGDGGLTRKTAVAHSSNGQWSFNPSKAHKSCKNHISLRSIIVSVDYIQLLQNPDLTTHVASFPGLSTDHTY